MPQPLEPASVASLVSLGLLCALALRRLVLMERFLVPRVVLLTALLWLPVFYLFCLAFEPGPVYDCPEPGDDDRQYFCISEF